MADGLGRILSKPGFDPDNFVAKRAAGGQEELTDVREQIQSLAEDTAVALKKNVYKNYSQFIETAKEISILEGEMYQLSHMLTDQKSIMAAMLEMSITGDKVETADETETSPEEEAQRNLAFLLEKVEGCSSVTEVPGRYLVHDSDLSELDPESFTKVNSVHVFLLNDSLMLATWLPQRRGPVKYKFQVLYELDSLAVVNARDVGGCKNAFKILMFPDTRMFQADNPKAKRQWLDILEETKKKKASMDNQRKEAAAAAVADRTSAFSMDSDNPFAEDEDEEEVVATETMMLRSISMMMERDLLLVEWVQELPEDLDVCIAQRDFEGAVDLVNKINEHLLGSPKSPAIREYKSRIDYRVKQLTDVLVQELQVSPERSLRGGPRSARRAVTQLIRLGKSAQACELFLKNRSAITKYNFRQLKIEGATTLYIKRLCQVFFGALMETGREFMKAFPRHYGCFSAFVIWARGEVKDFVRMFGLQVFGNKATLSSVAECVSEAKTRCDQLKEIGLELTFVLDGMMLPDVEKVVREAIEIQTDAVKHRAAEDLWRPINFKKVEAIDKFEEEMMELGILHIHNYTIDDCFTTLTANTVHFTKAYLGLCGDLMRVYCQELHSVVSAALVDLLLAQVKHAERSMKISDFQSELPTIVQNGTFLVEVILPMVQDRFLERTGMNLPRSADFKSLLQKIKAGSRDMLGEFV